MNKKSIGNLINYERTKKRISTKELADGICSVSALQRLENGERLPDFFVLERIIERLGNSVNKLEFLYNEVAYEIYYLREVMERLLEEKEYDEVEKALDYYEEKTVSKEPLHRQYIYKIQGVIAAEKNQNHEEAKKLFEKALEQTLQNFRLNDLENRILGERELQLLMLWLQECMEVEEASVPAGGEQLLSHIEWVYQDEEAKANIYSKAAWVLGTMEIKQENWQKALWYTLQGEKVLAENGLLVHLSQFLERILRLTENDDMDLHIEWKKQRDALKQIYEEYGIPWEADGISLWKSYRQQEVYLVSELFEQERKLVNQSQEKLADVLEIDQKTISRIESGRFKPKAGTFQKMKEYLQIDRDICTTRIVVDDFSLLDLEREIAKLNHHRREKEAEVLYKQLKKRLSLKWKENVQYIKYMDTLFDMELGRITPKEAIEACLEAFHVTRKNVDINQIEEIVLSRMETFIINYIARCYDKMGEKEKSIELLEKVVRGYESSKVDLKYHYVGVSLVYQHLAFDYEECDKLEEAIKWCDKFILFSLQCKKGLSLGFVLEEKCYTIDRITKDRSSSKSIYQQAYQLMKLMKKEKQMKSLQKIYDEWYEEKIDI